MLGVAAQTELVYVNGWHEDMELTCDAKLYLIPYTYSLTKYSMFIDYRRINSRAEVVSCEHYLK